MRLNFNMLSDPLISVIRNNFLLSRKRGLIAAKWQSFKAFSTCSVHQPKMEVRFSCGCKATKAASAALRFALGSAFIAVKLCPPRSPTPLPADAVLSARATLQLVLKTRTKGTTMCL
jgi:hypothetical protein